MKKWIRLSIALIYLIGTLGAAIIMGRATLRAAEIEERATLEAAKIANHPQNKPPGPDQPIEIAQNDAETHSLYNVYEALGDQSVVNNDFLGGVEHYTNAIQYLEKAINEQGQFLHEIDINEVKNSLSLVERKKENCEYVVEFFTKYSLENKNSTDSNYLYDLEVIARNWADLKMWKNAVIWNYCLFNQNTIGSRRERIINDLQYTFRMWQASDDFEHDISNQPIMAFVNDTNVRFRWEPVLEDNVIRQFNLFEKVRILQKSDFKQSIDGVNAHWYKISSEDGSEEGWIFGQYIMISPSVSNQSVMAVVNDTNVNFRREPVLENNVIRQFELYETVQVLEKSNFKQSIEGANAYWYKISSEDGTVGWIFGQYLMFLP